VPGKGGFCDGATLAGIATRTSSDGPRGILSTYRIGSGRTKEVAARIAAAGPDRFGKIRSATADRFPPNVESFVGPRTRRARC
jgi:hypothetical protein